MLTILMAIPGPCDGLIGKHTKNSAQRGVRDTRGAPLDCSNSNGTITRDDSSVRATIKFGAKASFSFGDQFFSLFSCQGRDVVDIETTLAAKTNLLITRHYLPISLARRRNIETVKRFFFLSHAFHLARDRLRRCLSI